MATISVENAYEYLYEPVAKQFVSDHRWSTTYLIVYKDDTDALWGFYYDEPATEMQEGQDVFINDPVPTFPVEAREITVTKYEPVK